MDNLLTKLFDYVSAGLGEYTLIILIVAGLIFAYVYLRKSKVSQDVDLSGAYSKLVEQLQERIKALEAKAKEYDALDNRVEALETEIIALNKARNHEQRVNRILLAHIETLYEWVAKVVPEKQPPAMPELPRGLE